MNTQPVEFSPEDSLECRPMDPALIEALTPRRPAPETLETLTVKLRALESTVQILLVALHRSKPAYVANQLAWLDDVAAIGGHPEDLAAYEHQTALISSAIGASKCWG